MIIRVVGAGHHACAPGGKSFLLLDDRRGSDGVLGDGSLAPRGLRRNLLGSVANSAFILFRDGTVTLRFTEVSPFVPRTISDELVCVVSEGLFSLRG